MKKVKVWNKNGEAVGYFEVPEEDTPWTVMFGDKMYLLSYTWQVYIETVFFETKELLPLVGSEYSLKVTG
jgi:hypothetical protein